MKKKTINLIEIFETKINNINNKSVNKSTLIYSASKDFFETINELGKEELKAYLKNLDKENIDATSVNFQIVNCLLVFAMEKYSKSEFLQLIYPLCKDPNNNQDLINKIEPKRSKWKVIRWLQGILNGFKREEFVINSNHSSAAAFERAYKVLHLSPKKIDLEKYIGLSQHDRTFSAHLSLMTRTIFSIAVEPNESNSSNEEFPPPPPSPQELCQLLSEEKTTFSNNVMSPPPPPPPLLGFKKITIQSNNSVLDKKVRKSNVVPLEKEFTLNSSIISTQLQKLKSVKNNLENNFSDEKSNNAMENLLKIVPVDPELRVKLSSNRQRITESSSSLEADFTDSDSWSEVEVDEVFVLNPLEIKKESKDISSETDSGFESNPSFIRKKPTTEESNKETEKVAVLNKLTAGNTNTGLFSTEAKGKTFSGTSDKHMQEQPKSVSVKEKCKLFGDNQNLGGEMTPVLKKSP